MTKANKNKYLLAGKEESVAVKDHNSICVQKTSGLANVLNLCVRAFACSVFNLVGKENLFLLIAENCYVFFRQYPNSGQRKYHPLFFNTSVLACNSSEPDSV